MDAREEINLRVLRKFNPGITKILKQSPYVVLYSYSTSDASWSKLPFEGTLFVYLTSSGNCGYRILNRLALDSFGRELRDPADVVETEGYVIHRCGEDIWGLWIWDGADRTNIYGAMVTAAETSRDSRPSQSSDGDGQGQNQGKEINVANLFDSAATKQAWVPTSVAQ